MADDAGTTSRRDVLKVSGAVMGGLAVGAEVTVAASDERFIVDTRQADLSSLRSSAEVVHELDGIDVAVVRGAESAVESVTTAYEPDTVYSFDRPGEPPMRANPTESDAEPADTDALLYPAQWDKQAQSIPEAQETSRGEGARVTVIDTGIGTFLFDDVFHPDLNVNTDLSRNFTDDGGDAGDVGFHGTAVAGVVAAQGVGVLGSAPDAELVSCRVFEGSFGTGGAFGDVLAAIEYSVDIDADVVNLSLGAYPVSRKGLGQFYGKVLNRTTARANSNDTLLIAAAGNAGADLQNDGSVISLPNEAANTVSVSATSTAGFDPLFGGEPSEAAETPTSYTNFGTNAIDVSAPGGDSRGFDGSLFDFVLTTAPPFNTLLPYVYIAGTSFAAPQVAGAAALLKAADGNLDSNQLRATLKRTAVDAASIPGDKEFHGAGFLTPTDALDSLSD